MEKFYPIFLREKDIDALRALLTSGRFDDVGMLVPGLRAALADPLPRCAADVVLGDAPVIVSTVLNVGYGSQKVDVFVTSMFKDAKLSIVMEMPRGDSGPSLAMTVERVFATWLGMVLREIRGVGNARGVLADIADACRTQLNCKSYPENLNEAIELYSLSAWVEIFCAPDRNQSFSSWTRYTINTHAFNFQHSQSSAELRETYGNLVFDHASTFAAIQNKQRKGAAQ